MFEIGWTELMLIGIVALIVVGPKELPEMFRTLGRVTAKARMMARDFQRAMEDAADQTGLKDISRDIQQTTAAVSSPLRTGLDAVNRRLDEMDGKAKPSAPKPATEAAVVATEPVVTPDPVPVASTPVATATVEETPKPAKVKPVKVAAESASPGKKTAKADDQTGPRKRTKKSASAAEDAGAQETKA